MHDHSGGALWTGRKKAYELIGGSSRNLLDRPGLRLVVALAACAAALCGRESAQAFDFFGLWSSEDSSPPVSPTAISYSVAVDVAGDDRGIRNAVTDASSLYRLRKDAPPDGEALARRAAGDFVPVIDALWGAGYYNATVTISLGAASLTVASSDVAAFARAAESYRNRAVAPVAIRVDPGPLFGLRTIRVVNVAGAEFSQDELPPGSSVSSRATQRSASALRAAETRIIDWFRNQGRPLAKVQSIAPVVDHAAEVMDVTVAADPGPVATFGEATMTGPESFDPGIARSFLYIQPGDPYSPRALQDARTSIRQIPAVGGVRITEGTALDATAASRIRSTSRTACPTPSAGRRNIRRRMVPPARSTGRTECLRRGGAAAPAGGHLLRAAVVRDPPRTSRTSRSTISADDCPRAS